MGLSGFWRGLGFGRRRGVGAGAAGAGDFAGGGAAGAGGAAALLEGRGVVKYFHGRGGVPVRAVDGVSVAVAAGEVFCVVGESGCGKSTLARVLAGLLAPTAGEVFFRGERIDEERRRGRRGLRGLQMIFQNPFESLNPRMTVRQTLEEAVRFHFAALTAAERQARIEQALAETGLGGDAAGRFPHQFSGGQRQRISIARALIVRPACIIADEPVAALDVSVQAQILNLLGDLQAQHGLGYFFITHDLGVVEHFADRVAVMYAGMVCETGRREEIFSRPRHPYTRVLLRASPKIGKTLQGAALAGEPPSPLELPGGCAFHPRCPYADARCRGERPGLAGVPGGGLVACHGVMEGRV